MKAAPVGTFSVSVDTFHDEIPSIPGASCPILPTSLTAALLVRETRTSRLVCAFTLRAKSAVPLFSMSSGCKYYRIVVFSLSSSCAKSQWFAFDSAHLCSWIGADVSRSVVLLQNDTSTRALPRWDRPRSLEVQRSWPCRTPNHEPQFRHGGMDAWIPHGCWNAVSYTQSTLTRRCHPKSSVDNTG